MKQITETDQKEIQNLIARSCWLLDNKEFDKWIDLFSEGAQYTITAYSLEIRKQMIWMQHDKESLGKLLKELSNHVVDKARRRHIFSIVDVEFQSEKEVNVITNFAVFRTDVVGRSSLYVVGEYKDICIQNDDQWLIKERSTYLDTRQLDLQSQFPL